MGANRRPDYTMLLPSLSLLMRRSRTTAALGTLFWIASSGYVELSAQIAEDFPAVRLDLVYGPRSLPVIAIQPFISEPGHEEVAREVEGIMTQDLRNSDRFDVWNQDRASPGRENWLVVGRIEGEGGVAVLSIELHDMVVGGVANHARFTLPPAEFRMAVHRASDSIVQWVFGEPGIAATRIVFSQRADDLSQELWMIDSDGANLRRLTHSQSSTLGHPISAWPAWSPDGSRIAYISLKDTGIARLYELDLRTGRERVIPITRSGIFLTPSYHPDGERLFFAIDEGDRTGIHSYNITRDCCFATFLSAGSIEISPTFSPDGSAVAFNSSRLGGTSPQIYWVSTSGTTAAEILSPFEFGRPSSFSGPEWSPLGNRVAFHGWVDQRGTFQVLVAELNARNRPTGLPLQVTLDGVNEDPSWAPDGRHLVYVGERSWGRGLFIVDIFTPGSERVLVRGIEARVPAWSPSLAP